MDDGALREALKKLLAHGEAAEDSKLMKMAAAKKAPPPAAPEMCPECQKPLVEGKCPECGYEKPVVDENEGQGDLASLLEQGASAEG